MGRFSYDQVNEEKIKGHIDANLTLAQLLTTCLELAQDSFFDEKTGEIGQLPSMIVDEAWIVDFIRFCLTDEGAEYDLRYPEKAIQTVLLELEESYLENFDRAKAEQLEWNYRQGIVKRPPRDIP